MYDFTKEMVESIETAGFISKGIFEADMFLKNQKFDKKISQNNVKLDYLTKDSKKSPASTSGRWIAFFIEKRIHPWYNFCIKYRREVINNKISKEIIKNNIQNQREV